MDLVSENICAKTEPWTAVYVPSHTMAGLEYRVMRAYPDDPPEELICSCPGYRYRGTCRHQVLAMDLLECGWTESLGPEKQSEPEVCPRCGAPTIKILEWIRPPTSTP